MAKVYLCWNGYEDIEHVFDSREKAEKWLEAKHEEARARGASQAWFCDIEERELE